MAPRNPQFSLYLPRAVLSWDLEGHGRARQAEGTLMFADLSGFTALVERMGAKGRAGAEEISEKINGVFDRILSVVRDEGGDVLKFGGDASLVLFQGPDHALSASLAALDMQDAMEELPEFGISIGLESGPVEMVLVGSRYRDFLVAGPAVQGVLRAEKAADSGEVVVGPELAALLPPGSVDDARLIADPDDLADLLSDDGSPPVVGLSADDSLDLADFVPVGLRDSLTVAGTHSEHRHVATGFLHVTLDPDRAVDVDALADLVEVIAESAERHDVAILASDVELGGLKFLLCAGAPSSSHHEEERMLRAMRRILDGVPALPVKAGVTRGLVFAGDFGAPWRRYYTLLGDSVNLAARLMSIAEPGQLLTLDNVVDRSPTRFDTRRLDPVRLKGKSKPVTPLSVDAILGVDRVDWARFLPLTGRAEELAQIADALTAAREGAGRAVVITGESGVGKTRLLDELIDRAAMVDAHIVICEQYESSTPYFAAGHLVRGVLGLKPTTEPEEVVERLADVVGEFPDLADWMPLIGVPLGVDIPPTSAVTSLAEEFRTTRTHEVVAELLTALRPDPTLIAVEDAHWMDDASRELFSHLASIARQRPWLLVTTSQPHDESLAIEGADRIELEGLADDEARLLVRLAAREMPASDQVIESIVETSGGHPLFALELLRHADADQLPESVEAVVTQRIDRLASRDRQLLRFVSVLGNSFSLDLLAEALPEVAASAEDADTWNRLGDFLDVTVFGTVQFKQDLIRKAAYDGLVYRRRHEIHGIVGEAIERQSRRRVARHAPLLSQHFHLAQRWDKAAHYSGLAADQALAKGASVEALQLYERRLEALDELGEDGDDRRVVFERLGDAAALAGRLERAAEALAEAIGLAVAEADRLRLARKLGEVWRDLGRLDDARETLALATTPVGEADDAEVERIECLVALAGVEHRAGRFEEAERCAAEAMENAETVGARSAFASAAMIRVANLQYLNRDIERDLAQEAAEVFTDLGDAHGLAKVLNNQGLAAYFRSDWAAAVEQWARAEEEYRRAGDVIGAAAARNNLGEVLSDRGHLDEAEDYFQEALRSWRAAGFPVGVALATLNLARVQARRGRRSEATELFAEASDGFAAAGYASYVLECRVRRIELDAHLGLVDMVAEGLASLDEEVDSSLAPVVDRLAVLAALAASPVERSEVSDALERAAATAEAAGSPYQAALTDRLRARLLDDDSAARRADEVLAALGAARAVGYLLPDGLVLEE